MHENTKEITQVILDAAEKARQEVDCAPEPQVTGNVQWPIPCTIGPGLEGAIAAESKIGYVNGSKGWLIYRGYDIFDLCAHSTYEEVAYLLIHGDLPSSSQYKVFKRDLVQHGYLNKTLRRIMSFPIEDMHAMAALRLGSNLMRQEFTHVDTEVAKPDTQEAISSDEDSIPMETPPKGEKQAIYEFKQAQKKKKNWKQASGLEACYHLISGLSTLTAAIARIRSNSLPIEPDPELSHAANLLYMMNGVKPTPLEERVMDVALILHADHGMNASTFAAMVVASTLSDFYFSVGAGIAALSGPLHGGANEQVMLTLEEIGDPSNVKEWTKKMISEGKKISGMGHRVYKAYDPRARVLGPLAKFLVEAQKDESIKNLYQTAIALENEVVESFGKEKKIFPNVDFYSGIVYKCLGIAPALYTPIFAVSRVAGWTARVLEYVKNNRIFRPRAIYTGEFNKQYVSIRERN